MNLLEAFSGNVGVDLGCGEIRMAEKGLDGSKVRSVFKQVRGEGMPKHVGRDCPGDSGKPDIFFQ